MILFLVLLAIAIVIVSLLRVLWPNLARASAPPVCRVCGAPATHVDRGPTWYCDEHAPELSLPVSFYNWEI